MIEFRYEGRFPLTNLWIHRSSVTAQSPFFKLEASLFTHRHTEHMLLKHLDNGKSRLSDLGREYERSLDGNALTTSLARFSTLHHDGFPAHSADACSRIPAGDLQRAIFKLPDDFFSSLTIAHLRHITND